MNWEAIGAIGEIVGAIAVIATLFFLTIQLRQNTQAMEESNRLERVAAMDRHAESVAVWRGSIAANNDLAQIWLKALQGVEVTDLEGVRLNNMFVNFVNIQRSNYERALAIGEHGLCKQAAKSIAVESSSSSLMLMLWGRAKPWHALASPGFVQTVEDEIAEFQSGQSEFLGGSWLTLRQDIRDATNKT